MENFPFWNYLDANVIAAEASKIFSNMASKVSQPISRMNRFRIIEKNTCLKMNLKTKLILFLNELKNLFNQSQFISSYQQF